MTTVEAVVGVIGRAHGVRGEVVIALRTDEPKRRFSVGQVLRSEDGVRSFTVAAARDHSGRLLVSFANILDRAAAESVRGVRLVADVPVDERPEDEDEFYDRQIVGLRAQTTRGEPIGVVHAVLHLPGQDVLEVDTPGGQRLVPFVQALVPDVDLAAGTVTIADFDGLLEGPDAW